MPFPIIVLAVVFALIAVRDCRSGCYVGRGARVLLAGEIKSDQALEAINVDVLN